MSGNALIHSLCEHFRQLFYALTPFFGDLCTFFCKKKTTKLYTRRVDRLNKPQQERISCSAGCCSRAPAFTISGPSRRFSKNCEDVPLTQQRQRSIQALYYREPNKIESENSAQLCVNAHRKRYSLTFETIGETVIL